MRPRSRPLALVLYAAPACQQAAPQDDSLPPPTTAPPAAATDTGSSTEDASSSTGPDSGDGSTTANTSTSSSGDEAETSPVLDVGSAADVGDGKPVGCQGKIDFLFVISRWAGMDYFQTQFLDALPKFIETIEGKFADFDYHIMVVDGDAEWGVSTCDETCPTPEKSPCTIEDYPCDYVSTECDRTMGAGVVYPAGDKAPNHSCPIDGGRRYMVKGQTDLEETFICAARVGTSGVARMGDAMAAALSPEMNAPGGCNADFLRDDALLMVTQISNTYDQKNGIIDSQIGNVDTWTDAVLAAKHGDPDAVVMLSILQALPECDEDDRICQMVRMFPHHLIADREEPDYGPSFEQATELVAEACAEFVPPG